MVLMLSVVSSSRHFFRAARSTTASATPWFEARIQLISGRFVCLIQFLQYALCHFTSALCA